MLQLKRVRIGRSATQIAHTVVRGFINWQYIIQVVCFLFCFGVICWLTKFGTSSVRKAAAAWDMCVCGLFAKRAWTNKPRSKRSDATEKYMSFLDLIYGCGRKCEWLRECGKSLSRHKMFW